MSNNTHNNSNIRSPVFGRRLGTGSVVGSRNNNTGDNLGARGLLNNLAESSSGKSELAWFMNIIPLLLICAFALAFRVMADRYTFCNISAEVCGLPQVAITMAPKNKDDNKKDTDDNSANDDDKDLRPRVTINCPENTAAEPKPPVTSPVGTIAILWVLFVLSTLVCIWVAMTGGELFAVILTAAIAITFLGLAIDASVNQNTGRSATAIMVITILIAVIVAIINLMAEEGSRRIAGAALVLALTLIGILVDNRKLIEDGHVGYALTRSFTMLLFVLNIVYILLLLVLLTYAVMNLGVGKALTSEYVALLLLICMVSQVAVFGSFLHKCLNKKYECIPAVKLSSDGIRQPDNADKNSASRLGDFITQCKVNGIESLDSRGATIAISILAVVVFLLSTPRTLVAIGDITGWAGKTSAGMVILVCIVLLVLSFVR